MSESVEWSQWLYYKYISPVCKLIFGRFTPNQITIFNLLFTIICGSYFISRGTWFGNLCGLGVLLINGLLDYVDGDLAKSGNKVSLAGQWLDKGGDMLIQNIIMASVAYSLCIHQFSNATLLICITYFIGLNAMNMISIFYNNTFGFDSHVGSELFRKYMDKKHDGFIRGCFNKFMKNLIDPTASHLGLMLWTVRYLLVFGLVFNQLYISFSMISILLTFRWIVMFVLYTLHLKEYKKLYVLQSLAILDSQREEYYKMRGQR